jgi:hypothetical protein
MGARIKFEHEVPWRRMVARAYPDATIVVLGRRQNRDDLSARVDSVEVGRYNRADDSPVEGWVELPPDFSLFGGRV